MFYLLRPILFPNLSLFSGLCSSNIPWYFLDFVLYLYNTFWSLTVLEFTISVRLCTHTLTLPATFIKLFKVGLPHFTSIFLVIRPFHQYKTFYFMASTFNLLLKTLTFKLVKTFLTIGGRLLNLYVTYMCNP